MKKEHQMFLDLLKKSLSSFEGIELYYDEKNPLFGVESLFNKIKGFEGGEEAILSEIMQKVGPHLRTHLKDGVKSILVTGLQPAAVQETEGYLSLSVDAYKQSIQGEIELKSEQRLDLIINLDKNGKVVSLIDPKQTAVPLLNLSKNTTVRTHQSQLELKVLVVDDNLMNRKVLSNMMCKLKQINDIPVTVTVDASPKNGQDAVDLIKTGKFEPDLILMDIQMPIMDGIEATKQIVEFQTDKTNKSLIVGVSGSSPEEMKSLENGGAKACLGKPTKLEAIQNILNSHLSPPRPSCKRKLEKLEVTEVIVSEENVERDPKKGRIGQE